MPILVLGVLLVWGASLLGEPPFTDNALYFALPVIGLFIASLFVARNKFLPWLTMALTLLPLIISIYESEKLWKSVAVGFVTAGAWANILVMAFNGFQMPVLRLKAEAVSHKPLNENSKLKFLADILPIKLGKSAYMMSIGDLTLSLGFLLLFVGALLNRLL